MLEAGRDDDRAGEGGQGQQQDMVLTTSKQDPHEKAEGEASTGRRDVTAGATDRDHPPRRLINQEEDKPKDTPLQKLEVKQHRALGRRTEGRRQRCPTRP